LGYHDAANAAVAADDYDDDDDDDGDNSGHLTPGVGRHHGKFAVGNRFQQLQHFLIAPQRH